MKDNAYNTLAILSLIVDNSIIERDFLSIIES